MRRILLLACVLYGISLNGQNIEWEHQSIVASIEHEVFKSKTYEITRQYTDNHNQVSHIYGFQTHNGVQIEGGLFAIHFKGSEIVSFTHNFIPLELTKDVAPHRFNYQEAAKSFLDRHRVYTEPNFAHAEPVEWRTLDQNHFQLISAEISDQPIDIEKTYAVVDNTLLPSWSVNGFISSKDNSYYTILNARDGSLIDEINQTLHCSANCGIDTEHSHIDNELNTTGQGLAANKKDKEASYIVFPFPTESPNHGDMQVIQSPEKEGSPYGWHDVNGIKGADYTTTKGNNVYASDDIRGANEPGYSPDGGSELLFDFPYKEDASPTANLDAAITGLFYSSNILHDVLHEYGFDVQSGNFQLNNYGTSPDGSGDPVLAEAQDGASLNNATFSFASDGKSPRMQMFLWTKDSYIDVLVPDDPNEQKRFTSVIAKFGPRIKFATIKSNLVLVQDSGASTHTACGSIENKEALKGSIALIQRGGCEYIKQVKRAQNAGAIAVIIFSDERFVVSMEDNNSPLVIEIPSVMVNGFTGQQLLKKLDKGSFEVALKETARKQKYDSDFDNGIIAHEYGHGLSLRLTGGPSTGACLENAEQMGEGWSDFLALAMTHRPEHTAQTPRGLGTYVKNQPSTNGGLRPYPYTTDTLISPYRYSQIATLYAPHGTGAVWCAMLWDLYWALIDVHGYDPDLYKGTGGNNLCLQLVIDGLKLQPCNPGFTDGRDAILLADKLNNGGANERIIWEAFARRGLGWSAKGGNPDRRTDEREAFDIPKKFLGYVDIKKTAESKVYEEDRLVYTVEIENASQSDYLNVIVTDTIPNALQIDPASLNCGWKIDGQVMSLKIDTLRAGEILTCNYTTKIPKGDYTQTSNEDGGEVVNDSWTIENHTGITTWLRQHETKIEGIWAWHINNNTAYCNQSLYFEAGLINMHNATLSFAHQFATKHHENGAIVELSTDKSNWESATPYFKSNGYNGIIDNKGTNTLDGKAAFSGYSDGFIYSEIDISAYQGKTLWVRFRFISGASNTEQSWYIDDLKIGRYASVTNTAFALVNDKKSQSQVYTEILDTDEYVEPKDSIVVPETGGWIYPNPVTNTLFIQLQGSPPKALLSITTTRGKQVMHLELTEPLNEIDLSTLTVGTYIVTLHEQGTTKRQKLIKS